MFFQPIQKTGTDMKKIDYHKSYKMLPFIVAGYTLFMVLQFLFYYFVVWPSETPYPLGYYGSIIAGGLIALPLFLFAIQHTYRDVIRHESPDKHPSKRKHVVFMVISSVCGLLCLGTSVFMICVGR